MKTNLKILKLKTRLLFYHILCRSQPWLEDYFENTTHCESPFQNQSLLNIATIPTLVF